MRRLWQLFLAFLHKLYVDYLTSRAEQSHPHLVEQVLEDPAKRELRRITLEGLCPPDTVSMGVMNGGPAVFFTHDRGKEVFIGHTFEHAADNFLVWMRDAKSRGAAYVPPTKNTTKLSRHDRRAYASKKFRNKHKR